MLDAAAAAVYWWYTMYDTPVKTPSPPREKILLRLPHLRKSITRQGKSPHLFQPRKNPPAQTSTNSIGLTFATFSGTPERQEPSSAWDKGWESNIRYNEANHSPTVGGGGRTTTATIDDMYGDIAESRNSARYQLGKEITKEEQWEEDKLSDTDTEDPPDHQGDAKIQQIMESL